MTLVAPSAATQTVSAAAQNNSQKAVRFAEASKFGADFQAGQALSTGVLNRLVEMAATPDGKNALAEALTGTPANQLSDDQRIALNTVIAGLSSGKVAPTVHSGVFADQTIAGMFVAKDNAILVSSSLKGAALTEAVTEETGEAVAAFASKTGLVLQPGDAGARIAAALRGEAADQADTAARASDTATTTFTTEAGDAVSVTGTAKKAVKGTGRNDRMFVEAEADHFAYAGNDRVVVFPGSMTDFLLDGGSGRGDTLHIAGLLKEQGNNIVVHQIGKNAYRIFVKAFYDGPTIQNSYFDIKNFEFVIEGPSGAKKPIADFVAPYLEKK